MKISYDPEADAIYIELRDVRPVDSKDIEEGITVDLGDDGHVVGIEILDARERLGAEGLESVVVEVLREPLRKSA